MKPDTHLPGPQDGLLAVLGKTALQRLIDAYGGRVIRVPKRLPPNRTLRDRTLVGDLKRKTYAQTARDHNVGVSTVLRAAQRIDPAVPVTK
jgi:hypothetical protein